MKHELVYARRDGGMLLADDINLIKSEPRLHSPAAADSGPGPSPQVYWQGNKRRVDEWMSSPSTPAPAPLTPSPGEPSHPYTVISNGYSSPTMSSGSYDPYSPNGKIGKSLVL